VTRLAARRRTGQSVALPPQVLLLGSIASVQFGAGIAVRLFDQAGPGGVVLMRLLFSGALLWAFARPPLGGRSRTAIAAAVGFGLILGTMNWSFYEALDRLPLGVAVTIEFLGPLGVALAGSRRALDLVWVVLAGSGVALLTLHREGGEVTPAGVLLALVAAVCWAAYILLSQRVGAEFEALDGLAISLAVASLVVLPVGLAQGGTTLLRPEVFLGGLGVAMLSSLIPYSLEIVALRRLSASVFGLLMSLQPAFGALAGVIVLGQSLTVVMLGAIVMVVLASIGTTVYSRRPPRGFPAQGQQ
jgi:inner membrane transporter RhtA